MNKKIFRNILVILLVTTLAFAALRYIGYLKDNINDLQEQKQNLLVELEKEKITTENLRLKNASLAINLRAAYKRLYRSFLDLRDSEKEFEEVNSRADLLRRDNAVLLEEKAKLTEENETFKSTLTSIPELKGIIQELKRLAKIKGNQGFLIKSGKNKSTSKVKIEVVPAPTK
jgi:glutaredoxin-related protein